MAPSFEYVDLQPGWRLRVVTPWLASGGYRLQLSDQQTSGNTVTLTGGEDLIGYETAYYAVMPGERGGVRIEFGSAELTKDGETSLEPHPQPWRLHLPANARFVRLVYLTRLSQADHDMAVVAADDREVLDTLTREVQANPSSACGSDDRRSCSWVPAGIAVRPEMRRAGADAEGWGPAR